MNLMVKGKFLCYIVSLCILSGVFFYSCDSPSNNKTSYNRAEASLIVRSFVLELEEEIGSGRVPASFAGLLNIFEQKGYQGHLR